MHNIIEWIFKLLTCFNIVSSMSSLPKSILHELLCFQELLAPNLKKSKSRVSENQVCLNIEEKERHLKV
jgi:hypothetical protein